MLNVTAFRDVLYRRSAPTSKEWDVYGGGVGLKWEFKRNAEQAASD